MGAEQVFSVEYGQLDQHANTVDDIAGKLATVRSTAGDTIDPQAYGRLCQPLPPTLNDTSKRAAEALAEAAQSLTDMASALRSAGASFEHADGAGA